VPYARYWAALAQLAEVDVSGGGPPASTEKPDNTGTNTSF
jgi:hypothetical protein